ncbi:glycosyltransferase family 2 protein [soil metagenome]
MIHICIPVHDEAGTIGILLWKIRKVMAEFGRDYEIVVLDDASTDGTAQVLDRYRRVLPLRTLRSETRSGYAAATERLLRDVADRSRYPKRDLAVTLQGDFTEDPEDLVAMVKAVEGGADLVVGQLGAGSAGITRPLRAARWMARMLVGSGRGAPVSEPMCGFRAYRLVVLRKAFREAEPQGDAVAASEATATPGGPKPTGGWAANVLMLARTAPHARRIDEAPYTLRLDPRARPTRLEVMEELKGLFPLRKVRWVNPAAEAA